jgi:putative aminopeptidase FrvX
LLESLKALYFDMLKVGSPSGFEEPMMKKMVEELKPLCDEVYHTPRGNVVGIQLGNDPEAPKVVLAAHMDQVGFVVFNVDPKGFIRFRKLGGAVNRCIQGQQVKLLTEKGPIIGVVGIKPGHITRPEEANTVPPINEMYIDVGAHSSDEVNEMGIMIGTPIVWNTRPAELANNLVTAATADDRAGLAVIITVAKNLHEKSIPSTVYYVGTVEEEIGLRGAAVAVHDLDPDIAIAIDTCPAGYQPDVNMRDLYYEIGKGPCIQIGEFGGGGVRLGSQVVRKWLIESATKEAVPYQTGFMHGGTDASAMQQTKAGVAALAFSIPRRYSHSPVEVMSMDDLYNMTKILTKGLKSLNRNFITHRI